MIMKWHLINDVVPDDVVITISILSWAVFMDLATKHQRAWLIIMLRKVPNQSQSCWQLFGFPAAAAGPQMDVAIRKTETGNRDPCMQYKRLIQTQHITTQHSNLCQFWLSAHFSRVPLCANCASKSQVATYYPTTTPRISPRMKSIRAFVLLCGELKHLCNALVCNYTRFLYGAVLKDNAILKHM